jgi:homoaconitase/3-isopropylmalate dehydratase large subunit
MPKWYGLQGLIIIITKAGEQLHPATCTGCMANTAETRVDSVAHTYNHMFPWLAYAFP